MGIHSGHADERLHCKKKQLTRNRGDKRETDRGGSHSLGGDT